jgi:hypothetical protein
MEHAGGFHPAAHSEENDASLLGIEVEDASRYGWLEVSADHRLTALREKQPGRGLDQVTSCRTAGTKRRESGG